MKKIFQIYLLLFIGFSFAQSSFYKGYFITINGEKIDCLIENKNWVYNPISFKYKKTLNSEVLTKKIENIKEFEIFNKVKYVKREVNIDLSSSKTSELSTTRKSKFEKRTLLLKVLLEGDINLYQFSKLNLERFFYAKDDSIIGLEFKKYLTQEQNISQNLNYKLQLKKDLSCDYLPTSKVDYSTKDLIKYFKEYANCKSLKIYKDYDLFNKNKSKLNLFGEVSYGINSIEVSNNLDDRDRTKFDGNYSIKFGLELEYVLGFNNNKWSVFIAPTYQKTTSEKEVTVQFSSSSAITYNGVIDYSSIEVPLGVRHYVYLNEKNKLFLSAGFIIDLYSSGEFRRDIINSGTIIPTNIFSEVKTDPTFFGGFGYTFDNKYRLQFQYNFKRNILNSLANNGELSNFSIKLGYNFW